MHLKTFLCTATATGAALAVGLVPSLPADAATVRDDAPASSSPSPSPTAAAAAASVGATVGEVDVAAGTATLQGGTAPTDATDVEISYTNADGRPERLNATVTDGTWTKRLQHLAVGATTVHLEAFDGGQSLAEADVTVTLRVIPLEATPRFGTAVEEVAEVTGTATPRAEVVAHAGEQQVASTTADDRGTYSLSINPPNTAGTYDLRVSQRIRGTEQTPVDVTLDYGDGVTITSPEPDSALTPGADLVVRGTAQPGTELAVHEAGKPAVPLAHVTAGSNGTYRAVVSDLEDREYELVATGISKGYNRTAAAVTINPGDAATPAAPSDVSGHFPQNVKEWAHITGSGITPGATVQIKQGDETIAESPATGSTFDFGIDPNLVGWGKQDFTVTQTVDGKTSDTTTVTLDYAPDTPPTVTTPVAFGKIAPSGQEFTGTGVDGAVLGIHTAALDDYLAETTLGSSTDWTMTADADITLPDGWYQFYVHQFTKGGKFNQAVPVSVQVDSTPTAPTSVAGRFPQNVQEWAHITGSGITPGATVHIKQGNRTIAESPATGSTFDFGIDPNLVGWGTQTFTVTQTVDGKTSAGTEVSLDYAPDTPPTVTDPVMLGTIAATGQEFTGTGIDGATLGIHGVTQDAQLAQTTLDGSTTWTMTIDPDLTLSPGWYQFFVHQFTRGGKFNQAEPVSVQVAP